MKTIHETFTEHEHEQLTAIKGDRTWREAILVEFGVEVDTDD